MYPRPLMTFVINASSRYMQFIISTRTSFHLLPVYSTSIFFGRNSKCWKYAQCDQWWDDCNPSHLKPQNVGRRWPLKEAYLKGVNLCMLKGAAMRCSYESSHLEWDYPSEQWHKDILTKRCWVVMELAQCSVRDKVGETPNKVRLLYREMRSWESEQHSTVPSL